jgi:hypothetical protein
MPNASCAFVRKPARVALLLAMCLATGWAATLERLSLDDMIAKSTAIVHGRVTGSYSAFRGSVIYTHFKVSVLEQYKGTPLSTADVLVPGGTAQGIRQTYPGTPQLAAGQEYLLFLWTSSAGATYTLGFTQGVFTLPKDSSGQSLAVREPTTETILDPVTGDPVKDEPIRMPLAKLTAYISARLGAKSQ